MLQLLQNLWLYHFIVTPTREIVLLFQDVIGGSKIVWKQLWYFAVFLFFAHDSFSVLIFLKLNREVSNFENALRARQAYSATSLIICMRGNAPSRADKADGPTTTCIQTHTHTHTHTHTSTYIQYHWDAIENLT